MLHDVTFSEPTDVQCTIFYIDMPNVLGGSQLVTKFCFSYSIVRLDVSCYSIDKKWWIQRSVASVMTRERIEKARVPHQMLRL